MNNAFTASDVFDAYQRIHPYLPKTPLEESFYLGANGRTYFFKLESAQHVKSFKIRGALNKILSLTEEEKHRGVATVSSGNHGVAVSYASKLLGIEHALVIVPTITPQAKIRKIEYYGAQVMLLGNNYDEAHTLGLEYLKKHNMTYIDSYYDDPKVYAGQGTVALELLEQNPDIDTIVIPIGGGSLITGCAVVAKHIKPDIRIIGVQTETCPAMIRALEDHAFYETFPTTGSTACESLVGGVGKLSYEMLADYVDDIIAVKESTIRKGVKHMLLNEKFVVEAGSATTVAAVMDFADRVGGKNVALVISGGNIDADFIKTIVNE